MQIDRRSQEPSPIEPRFREWLERIPGTVYVQQGEGTATTVYISPRVKDLVGLAAETFTDDRDAWSALVHPDDRERLHAADLASDATGWFRCEYRLRTVDGSYHWMRDEANRQADRADLWIGVLVDITEQKRTEEELRAAVRRFQTLVEQVPTVIYIESLEEAISPMYVSPHYESMFGFTPEERMADPSLWERLVHPDDREQLLAEIDALAPDAEGWSFEYRMHHRDGHVVWVQDQAVLVRDDDGTPLFYQGVLSDVTESRRAKDELQRALDELRAADELKNTFLSAVSHDLRTPLTAILGSARTIEDARRADAATTTVTSSSPRSRGTPGSSTELVTDLLDVDRRDARRHRSRPHRGGPGATRRGRARRHGPAARPARPSHRHPGCRACRRRQGRTHPGEPGRERTQVHARGRGGVGRLTTSTTSPRWSSRTQDPASRRRTGAPCSSRSTASAPERAFRASGSACRSSERSPSCTAAMRGSKTVTVVEPRSTCSWRRRTQLIERGVRRHRAEHRVGEARAAPPRPPRAGPAPR